MDSFCLRAAPLPVTFLISCSLGSLVNCTITSTGLPSFACCSSGDSLGCANAGAVTNTRRHKATGAVDFRGVRFFLDSPMHVPPRLAVAHGIRRSGVSFDITALLKSSIVVLANGGRLPSHKEASPVPMSEQI